jgi:predicted membrane-bound mannosyltransferase
MAAACGTAATAVGALDGTAQIIVAVFAGLAFLTALWVLRDRLAKWAEGRR